MVVGEFIDVVYPQKVLAEVHRTRQWCLSYAQGAKIVQEQSPVLSLPKREIRGRKFDFRFGPTRKHSFRYH